MNAAKIYDPAGMRNREDKVIQKITDYITPCFDDMGNYIYSKNLNMSMEKGKMPSREALWLAATMMASGKPEAVKKANSIFRLHIADNSIGGSFNLHATIISCLYYPDRTDNDIKAGLKAYLDKCISYVMRPEIGYFGINDNFPSMDASIAILGGQIIGRDEYIKRGHQLLKQAVAMLSRRGLMSEYGSPTYTPIALACMADIVNLAKNEEIKADALAIETRIWADVLGRYHAGTCQMAGPHSRSYMPDLVGHTHKGRSTYQILFGDEMGVNMFNTILSAIDGQDKELTHHGPHMMMATLGIYMLPDYHCPDYMAQAAKNRKYPYVFSATTESRERRDIVPGAEKVIYPGGVCRTYTYMEKDYAVGTSTKEFSNGTQTDCFFINYNKKNPAACQGDTSTVFSRYIIDDINPNTANEFMPFHMHVKAGDNFMDAGRKFGLQYKNSGFVAYGCKRWASLGASSLKLALAFPVHYANIETMWLGSKLLDTAKEGICGESVEPETVYVKDGPVIMAFKPTNLTNFGRKCAVRVTRTGDYVMAYFINYEGENRAFEEDELLLAKNGFAFEIREASDISIDGLRALADTIAISDDTTVLDGHPTGRTFKVSREGSEFFGIYCPLTESIRCLTINGLSLEAPVYYSSDIDAKKLPLYNAGWETPRIY